jgi:hypothetical protein
MDSTSEKNHSPIQNNKTPHAVSRFRNPLSSVLKALAKPFKTILKPIFSSLSAA